MRKRLPAIIYGAVAGAFIPALLFGVLSLLDDESELASFVGGLWVWSALPGALLAPGRGYFTLFVIESFWIVLGGFAAFVIANLRSRRNDPSR